MAIIKNKLLFFTTSPRTPAKMIPEIQLLYENFDGKLWNKETQEQFIEKLAQSNFFKGKGSSSDKAFSARDRITRAPKALGFINLKPDIEITEAGKAFVYGKRPQEIFLRQLLKFQLPSPYHLENKDITGTFCIRPYLEIFRLVRELEYITFDEFKVFAVQMTDYHKFDMVKDAILRFRYDKEQHKGQYKRFVNDVKKYKDYLFNAEIPYLYTDNKDSIIDILMRIGSFTRRELIKKPLEELKNIRDNIVKQRKEAIIHEQVVEIKSYALYSEIIDTFNEIISDEYYDAPLMLEYNTWRAMTMLDGGDIKGNFNFDDAGQPLSTAAGNMPDIECDYKDFALSVEVTLQSGQRQYESEGEPVARHYGQLKQRTGKDTYCLFIAPTINAATLAHFYGLNHLPIALYGGKSKIVPLELDQFMLLVENSYNYNEQPKPTNVRKFLDLVISYCEQSSDENEWQEFIQECVNNWLIVQN